MATHVGFIPENPSTVEYQSLLDVLRYITRFCGEKGINFNFETGQETPTTLMRMITDIGEENVGINLDPANLVMYGKANPVDALDVFGDKVMNLHAKDGLYPTNSPPFTTIELPDLSSMLRVHCGVCAINFPPLITTSPAFDT